MKIRTKSLFLLLAAIFTANVLLAETEITSIIYRTDFEDAEERNQWDLNKGPLASKCKNQWYWGRYGANGGDFGMFISTDGTGNEYAASGVSVVALRTLTLAEGEYSLTFDWRAGGTQGNDGLYVCWIPESQNVKINSGITDIPQEFIKKYAVQIDPSVSMDSARLYQQDWVTQKMTIASDGTPHHLVYVWINGIAPQTPPGACVDNIYIYPEGACGAPLSFNVNIKGDQFVLSWKGKADSYDVKVYCEELKEWYYYNGITERSLVVDSLSEGAKVFYVRSHCDSITSHWVSRSAFYFYPNSRCINYMNLTTNCRWGDVYNPYGIASAVDRGYSSKFSRHTLHYKQTDYDARTGNQLKAVPEGEMASVRLGNWNVGAEAESVSYDYIVDTLDGALLLLNYAVVMEDPQHEIQEQPRFVLDITEGGKSLQYNCGDAYFAAGHDMDSTWHQYTSFSGVNLWWKEWTTVGINLAEYHGRSLKIRLTTYDCTAGGHFGYAYFTLGCSRGKIEGLSCGDSPENAFKGPDGFKYRWYLPSDPTNILWTEQTYTVPSNDTLTYYLDVIQPTNENCYFTLQASAVARWPHASGSFETSIKDCQNVVQFTNSSYIVRENQVTNIAEKTGEPCEIFVWDFDDGTKSYEEHPTHVYAQGGKYTVTLSSGIANGTCMNDTTFILDLPMLGTFTDTTHAVICNGKSYPWKGENLFTPGIYADTIKTSYGCDSIAVLNLVVAERFDTLKFDTICSHEEYYFDGKPITKSGRYEAEYETVYGCDSIVNLDIIVNESLILNFDTIVSACGDDTYLLMPYERKSGLLDVCLAEIDFAEGKYSVEADVESQLGAIVVPLPEKVSPGYYNVSLSFGEKACGGEVKNIPLNVYYPKDIIVQRWGDVLAVKNYEYNGNYEFSAFQWYKNGAPIEGAISSIYYEEDGLDLDAEYDVLLTRSLDNVSIMTCVAELYNFASDNSSSVVIFSKEQESVDVESPQEARLRVWSMQGTLVKEVMLNEGYSHINLGISGVCLFEFIYKNGERDIKQVVIN